MSVVRLQETFATAPFLRVIQVCRAQESDGERPQEGLAEESDLTYRIKSAIASAKEFSVISSFLISREGLVDAVENAWKQEGARSYWMTGYERLRASYAQAEEDKRAAQDRELIAEMGEILDTVVLRLGPFHAKFVLVDPLGKEPKGFLTSCNLIPDAFRENLESFVELKPAECRQLYRLARHTFWHRADTELCEDGKCLAASKPFEAPIPEPEGDLIWTVGNQSNLIREHALRLIKEASKSIDICGHTWSHDHPVLRALVAKVKAGCRVRLAGWEFGGSGRQPPIHKTLSSLIEAGVEVFEVPHLHAKYLLTDKEGILGTANFHPKGLDEGIEVGLLLRGKRLSHAREAFAYFVSRASTTSKLVPALSLNATSAEILVTYRPEFPDTPVQVRDSLTLPPKVLVASCASTLREEAQEALRSHLATVAKPRDTLAAWSRQEAGKPSEPRILYKSIVVTVEARPPTVPSNLKIPQDEPTDPQVVKHKGRKWVAIPDPGRDTVLVSKALNLAKAEGCNVAFWD